MAPGRAPASASRFPSIPRRPCSTTSSLSAACAARRSACALIPIDSELASELGLAADYGLLVVQAVPGGAADRAGLRGGTERAYLGNMPIFIGGDLIVAIDGKQIENQQDLAQVMNNHRAGDTVKVTIFRGKKKLEVEVELSESREQV